MAVDYTRPPPTEPERLVWLAGFFFEKRLTELNLEERRELYKIAMMEIQIEEMRNLSFFLGEAYDIYNARFR